MKKDIEKFVVPALDAVANRLSTKDSEDNDVVYEEYDGYAASFGASVVTAGLLPTISFYTNVHKKEKDPIAEAKKPRRYKMLMAIADILEMGGSDTALLDYVIPPEKRNNKALKNEILHASIALKLALRNFKHIKSDSK